MKLLPKIALALGSLRPHHEEITGEKFCISLLKPDRIYWNVTANKTGTNMTIVCTIDEQGIEHTVAYHILTMIRCSRLATLSLVFSEDQNQTFRMLI
jgi:hypothetical protein